jgi:hypothetical protein
VARLTFRKAIRGPLGLLVNVSRRGVSSVSKRIGPVTVNSRGRWSLRTFIPGLSLRGRLKPPADDYPAELARTLQRERHWSQRKIAQVFGVSQPAVSQWLTRPTDNVDNVDDDITIVEGLDGKTYETPAATRERAPQHPWAPGGDSYRKVRAAVRALRSEPPADGLGPHQRANLEKVLGDLVEAAEEAQNAMAREDR